MFERFTAEARAVVVRAQEDAGALGAERIGTEHLLLGLAAADGGAAARVLEELGLGHDELRADLVRSGGGLDAAALAAIGIDLGEVERRVEESFGPGALRGRRGRPRFGPNAKKALELALREAIALGDREIRGEHVLLGVMRDPGERVRALLARRGQSPEAIRAAVLAGRARAA
jgi:ATP-dependent Clp protease ATP-binding subunit ClpA